MTSLIAFSPFTTLPVFVGFALVIAFEPLVDFVLASLVAGSVSVSVIIKVSSVVDLLTLSFVFSLVGSVVVIVSSVAALTVEVEVGSAAVVVSMYRMEVIDSLEVVVVVTNGVVVVLSGGDEVLTVVPGEK